MKQHQQQVRRRRHGGGPPAERAARHGVQLGAEFRTGRQAVTGEPPADTGCADFYCQHNGGPYPHDERPSREKA